MTTDFSANGRVSDGLVLQKIEHGRIEKCAHQVIKAAFHCQAGCIHAFLFGVGYDLKTSGLSCGPDVIDQDLHLCHRKANVLEAQN